MSAERETSLEGVEEFAEESREFAEASLPLAAEILPEDEHGYWSWSPEERGEYDAMYGR